MQGLYLHNRIGTPRKGQWVRRSPAATKYVEKTMLDPRWLNRENIQWLWPWLDTRSTREEPHSQGTVGEQLAVESLQKEERLWNRGDSTTMQPRVGHHWRLPQVMTGGDSIFSEQDEKHLQWPMLLVILPGGKLLGPHWHWVWPRELVRDGGPTWIRDRRAHCSPSFTPPRCLTQFAKAQHQLTSGPWLQDHHSSLLGWGGSRG